MLCDGFFIDDLLSRDRLWDYGEIALGIYLVGIVIASGEKVEVEDLPEDVVGSAEMDGQGFIGDALGVDGGIAVLDVADGFNAVEIFVEVSCRL